LALLVAVTASPLMAQKLFDVPVRINMGGSETIDSYGRIWLGDGPGVGDPLNIRPDDAGGTHTEENWLIQNFQPDSLEAIGFDPTHPGDSYIFNTIRWDEGALPPDYLLEIPVKEGTYTVNMYFNEGCCLNRHFKILMQGDVVDEDVSYLDYDPANPALGRVGVLPFPDIAVGADNILHISLLPCIDPECPGGGDTNPIVDAIEIISNPICDHLGLDFNCTFDPATGTVTASDFSAYQGGMTAPKPPAGPPAAMTSRSSGVRSAVWTSAAFRPTTAPLPTLPQSPRVTRARSWMNSRTSRFDQPAAWSTSRCCGPTMIA